MFAQEEKSKNISYLSTAIFSLTNFTQPISTAVLIQNSSF